MRRLDRSGLLGQPEPRKLQLPAAQSHEDGVVLLIGRPAARLCYFISITLGCCAAEFCKLLPVLLLLCVILQLDTNATGASGRTGSAPVRSWVHVGSQPGLISGLELRFAAN